MSVRSLRLAGSSLLIALGCSGGFSPADAAGGSGGTGGTGGIGGSGGTVDAASPDAADDAGIPPRCTRVTAETKVTSSPGGSRLFSFLWDADHYVLAAQLDDAAGGDISVTKLGPDGASLSPLTVVEATPDPSTLPRLVKTATGYVVVWEEGPATAKSVRAHALDANAAPVGVGVGVVQPAAMEVRPAPAIGPAGLTVAWMDVLGGVPSVRVGVLDATLHLRSDIPIQRLGTTTAEASYPWLAGSASTLGVIWSDARTGTRAIRFANLDSALAISNDTLIRSSTANAQLGRMIQTTLGFMAAWEEITPNQDNEIHMAITTSSGAVSAQGLVEEPGSGDANWPHIAWNGTQAGVVYYQYRRTFVQVFISFVDQTGARVGNATDLQVSNTPAGRARFPDVQWDGSSFGVMWSDSRDGTSQLYFARVICQ